MVRSSTLLGLALPLVLVALALAQDAPLSAAPAANPPGDPGAPPGGAKSSPDDLRFFTGDTGEIEVPLRLSHDLLSVRIDAGLSQEAGRNLLLQYGGVDGAAVAQLVFTERSSAYVPLLPGLTEETVRGIARAMREHASFVYAEPVYFHETERFGGTNRLVVKFADALRPREVASALDGLGLVPVKPLTSAPNIWVVEVPRGAAWNAVETSQLLLEMLRPIVDWSHPDFVIDRVPTYTPNDTNFGSQWHLHSTGQGGAKVDADIDAPEAWDITLGSSSVVIAVIDTGTDTAHEDLTYVPGWDAVGNDNNPSPGSGENHGTAVSGVAAAKGNNGKGVSGSCPNCPVMPIRLIVSGMTVSDEAEAFNFAWQNGASIINNSWGPVGSVATLPSSTKSAIDAATTSGRGGKGCVVLFAAGNDNKNVDANGYAAYSRVIAVAASTDQDLKAYYSNYGTTLEVCAPSNGGVTSGIWTTDRTGTNGYSTSNYTNNFGGTSSATPLVAGVVGLMLSVNANLTYTDVRTHLINTADKIDTAGGAYSGGYSTKYGYGKVNARSAVVAAQGGSGGGGSTVTKSYASTNVPLAIPDNNATGITSNLSVGDAGTITALTCTVNITHTYKGDLTVSLIHPDGSTAVLHNKTGGSADNVIGTFTVTTFNGKPNAGAWKLKVTDTAAQDVGTLNSWSITSTYTPASGPTTQTYVVSSTNVPLSIPDNNATGVTSVLSASGMSGTATDVNVSVNITHTYKGDLVVTLIHPDGTSVILHNRTGGSADNIVTTFDTLTAPAQSLSVLNGKGGNGTWQLRVQDLAAADVGTINSWSIQVTTVTP